MLQRLAFIKVKIDNFLDFIYLSPMFGIQMLIRLVSLILYLRGMWVDETGCLLAIGFLNQFNKVKLS